MPSGFRLALTTCVILAALSPKLRAAVVWATDAPGVSTITFTKPAFADPNVVNDPISPLVIIGRADDAGLFNLVAETFHTLGTSPAGTAWAFAGLNGNPVTVSAADFASLNFTDWANSLGARFQLLGNIENRPGVVHLIDEDIYLDLMFTSWGGPGSGGHFTYVRTTGPIPEPATGTLVVWSLPFFFRRRRAR